MPDDEIMVEDLQLAAERHLRDAPEDKTVLTFVPQTQVAYTPVPGDFRPMAVRLEDGKPVVAEGDEEMLRGGHGMTDLSQRRLVHPSVAVLHGPPMTNAPAEEEPAEEPAPTPPPTPPASPLLPSS